MNRSLASIYLAALTLIGCGTSEPSIEQLAPRLLITGVDGTSLNDSNPIIEDIRSGISGVILFERNLVKTNDNTPLASSEVTSKERLRRFIADMKSLRSEPLIISIDQEGGFVNRLKPKYGFRPMPSQRSVADVVKNSGSMEYAHQVATTIAQELSEVGVNLNFSPCVDVDINPACPVIGHFERSFSADEQMVSSLAKIYIEEHHKQGVLTSLKHFPGHGSSLVDSHLGLTDITHTWHAERELHPYRELINSEQCDMVMVSHLFNETIDPNYPATLSRPTIDSLLRGVLEWRGVVITDDMQMKAIVDHYGFDEAITLAINAGVDLFIVGGNIRREKYSVRERLVKIVTEGVKSGKISEARVRESVARIDDLFKRVPEKLLYSSEPRANTILNTTIKPQKNDEQVSNLNNHSTRSVLHSYSQTHHARGYFNSEVSRRQAVCNKLHI